MGITKFFDFLQSFDSEIFYYIDQFGIYIYIILFAIVFGKTGFVILNFLPGDSLVFACGTLAAVGQLNIWTLFFLFFFATLFADSNNFYIGRIFRKIQNNRFRFLQIIPQHTLDKAKKFLDQYGNIAITFSRFIPLMRTMIPFIAGFTGYQYKEFFKYNVMGAFSWTIIWLGTGFALGNVPWVEDNLMLTLILITLIMFIPGIYGFITQFHKNKSVE